MVSSTAFDKILQYESVRTYINEVHKPMKEYAVNAILELQNTYRQILSEFDRFDGGEKGEEDETEIDQQLAKERKMLQKYQQQKEDLKTKRNSVALHTTLKRAEQNCDNTINSYNEKIKYLEELKGKIYATDSGIQNQVAKARFAVQKLRTMLNIKKGMATRNGVSAYPYMDMFSYQAGFMDQFGIFTPEVMEIEMGTIKYHGEEYFFFFPKDGNIYNDGWVTMDTVIFYINDMDWAGFAKDFSAENVFANDHITYSGSAKMQGSIVSLIGAGIDAAMKNVQRSRIVYVFQHKGNERRVVAILYNDDYEKFMGQMKSPDGKSFVGRNTPSVYQSQEMGNAYYHLTGQKSGTKNLDINLKINSNHPDDFVGYVAKGEGKSYYIQMDSMSGMRATIGERNYWTGQYTPEHDFSHRFSVKPEKLNGIYGKVFEKTLRDFEE